MKLRKSNLELLRLFCIFGIVSMHTFGTFYGTAEGVNLFYGVVINSIFNTGVSLFVLISGYFGIRSSGEKILKLWLQMLFYSVLSMAIISVIQDGWSTKGIIMSFVPFSSGKYWYMTSYMLLMFFAEYINLIPEKMSKEKFKKLLILMLVVFSILPTILQFHVMNDGGKGIMNMLLMYLIGRYIKIYYQETYSKRQLLFAGGMVIGAGTAFNYCTSIMRGGTGICAPFARDCSVIIIAASVIIFLLFMKIKISSRLINGLARHVAAIYLFEGAVRTVLNKYINWSIYGDVWYLFGIIAVYVLFVMMICIMVDVIREKTIGKWIEKIDWYRFFRKTE